MTEKIIELTTREHKYHFIDTPTAPGLIKEIFSDNYHVMAAIAKGTLVFQPGDVIVDVGACEGMFSILMSTAFPDTQILAYEPVPTTYHTLVRNLELNGCKNVKAFNMGLGPNFKQRINITTNKDGESGGSTSCCTFNPEVHTLIEVGLIPLDAVFELNGINRIRLLKMDVEGMEYDILYASRNLFRIDYFCGEFHINTKLEFQSRRLEGLINWVSNQTKVIYIEPCKMAE